MFPESHARLDSEYTKKHGDLAADSDFDAQESDFDPVDTALMPLEDQDPKLMHDYLTVPELSYAELVDPGKTVPLLLPYSIIWEALVVENDPLSRRYVATIIGALPDLTKCVDFRRLRSAIRFTYSLEPYSFINPARAPTTVTTTESTKDGKRLVAMGLKSISESGSFPATGPTGRGSTAVFFITGLVLQCSLVQPTLMGPQSAPYMNKMINIKPFAVEYERATSFLGNVLGVQKYPGPVYEGNLTFTTRRDVGSSGGCMLFISCRDFALC
jgi:hypothetical protein